jgi:hypothetical protein
MDDVKSALAELAPWRHDSARWEGSEIGHRAVG